MDHTPGPATHDAFNQLVHLIQYGQAAGAFIPTNPTTLASAIWACIHGAIHMSLVANDQGGHSGDRISLTDYGTVLEIVGRGVTAS